MTGAASSPSLATLVAQVAALSEMAEELGGEFSPAAALDRILSRCMDLMQCSAGSISHVDVAAGTYRKEAERGIHCQTGQIFSLDEGMTGEVVRQRSAVWFDQYDSVASGHLTHADRATIGATIGVPLEWRGEIIGACVLFSRDPRRRFGHGDAQLLSMFARHAALALANARMHMVVEARARQQSAEAERCRIADEIKIELVRAAQRTADGSLDAIIHGLVQRLDRIVNEAHQPEVHLEDVVREELTQIEAMSAVNTELVVSGLPCADQVEWRRDAQVVVRELLDDVLRHAAARTLRVHMSYQRDAVHLTIQDDGRWTTTPEVAETLKSGQIRTSRRVQVLGGTVTFESRPGWGTTVRLELPRITPAFEPSAARTAVVAAARPLAAAGLRALVTGNSVAVTGQAATCRDLADHLASTSPDVVVIGDERSEQTNEWVHTVRAAPGAARIVVVVSGWTRTRHEDLIALGVDATMPDDVDGDRISSLILAVAADDWTPATPPDLPAEGRLTGREREVEQLLLEGKSNSAISESLFISIKTVEKHVGSLLRKSGASNRAEFFASKRRAGH